MSSPLQRLMLLIGVAAGMVIAGLAWNHAAELVAAQRVEREARARQVALTAARQGRDAVPRLLDPADRLLAQVQGRQAALARGDRREAEAIEAALAQAVRAAQDGVRVLAASDAQGNITWTTQPGALPAFVGNQDFFLAHRYGRLAAVVARSPLQQQGAQPGFLLVRPMLGPGGFAGVSLATVDATRFALALPASAGIADPEVTLFHLDGTVILRGRGGRQVNAARLEPGLLPDPSGSGERSLARRDPQGGFLLVQAAAQVPGQDLVAVASFEDMTGLAENRRTALLAYGSAGGLTLLVLLAIYALLGRLHPAHAPAPEAAVAPPPWPGPQPALSAAAQRVVNTLPDAAARAAARPVPQSAAPRPPAIAAAAQTTAMKAALVQAPVVQAPAIHVPATHTAQVLPMAAPPPLMPAQIAPAELGPPAMTPALTALAASALLPALPIAAPPTVVPPPPASVPAPVLAPVQIHPLPQPPLPVPPQPALTSEIPLPPAAPARPVAPRTMPRTDFVALIAALPGVIYAARLDDAGQTSITAISSGIEAMTGHPPATFRDIDAWQRLIDWGSYPPGPALFERLLVEPEVIVEFRIRRGDGSWMWLRDHARLVTREASGADVLGMLADITRERDLATQADRSSLVAARGAMAAGLAHELHQPLAVMSLAAENALEALDEGPGGIAEAQTRLRRIAAQAERAKTIAVQLRAFARLEAAVLEPVSLPATVRGAMSLIGPQLRDAGIDVQSALPPGISPVRGQAVLVEQVLVNLCLNARDAMASRPAGSRRLRIAAGASSEPDDVLVTVTDTGGGISPEVLERAFDPFFTTKPPSQGTGLGLALCRSIMQRFGGSIALVNVAGGAEARLIFRRAGPAGERLRPAVGPLRTGVSVG